jgi:hypothetical protein
MARFVRYTKETDNGNSRSVEWLNGLRSTKKNYIHLSHGHNQWETVPTQVPTGFVESDDYDRAWVEGNVCRDPNPRPKNGLEIEQWEKKVRSSWLTIADIKRLSPGDVLDVAVLDRNVIETADSAGIPPNRPVAAQRFLKSSMARYEHIEGLRGKLTLLINSERIELDPFEFHVDFDGKGNWYPLMDGVLPAKDPQGFMKLLGKKTPWSAMSPKTHVGYRGPMIVWSKVRSLSASSPKIYWYKE